MLMLRRPSDLALQRDPIRDAIATRADELFVVRGGEHGHDVDGWLPAERELISLMRLRFRSDAPPPGASRQR